MFHSAILGYIGEFEIIDDHRSGKIVIQLNGRLNKTGVISPRFNVQATQIESWVNLLLPARSFGIIILASLLHLSKLRQSINCFTFRQHRREYLTMMKLAGRILVASFWVMFTRSIYKMSKCGLVCAQFFECKNKCIV
jgi:hypothetical protein